MLKSLTHEKIEGSFDERGVMYKINGTMARMYSEKPGGYARPVLLGLFVGFPQVVNTSSTGSSFHYNTSCSLLCTV